MIRRDTRFLHSSGTASTFVRTCFAQSRAPLLRRQCQGQQRPAPEGSCWSQSAHTLRLLEVLLSARRLRMSGRTNMRRMSAAGRTPPQTLFMRPPASKAQAGDPRSRADHRPFSFRRLCRSGTGAEDAYRVPERYLTGLPLPNTVSAGKCRNREMCRCYR